MPLQQFCSSNNKRASSSNAPFISPAIHAQEVYDAKFPQRSMERCASQTSTLSFSRDICRICHCEGDNDAPLIAPCYCAGSLRFVHQGCLQQWIKSSDTKCCELCKFPFLMHSKVKPFRKWERLDINGIERRKILFSVLFHIIAITCVVWSLYVLIERTSQEVQSGELEWPFWTKLIVVAIGFTGSVVFMYVQCKMYIHLYRRWRAFNRVIYIQNAPEVVLNDVETSKSQTDFQSESEKPFLALAVITSAPGSNLIGSTGSGVPNTNPGSCCTASSSPPGALWSDEGSPQLGSYPIFKDVSSSHRVAEEADTLIATSEVSSRNSGRSSSSCDPSRCLLSDDQGSDRRSDRKPKDKVSGRLGVSSARNGHQLSMTDSISSTCSSSASDSGDNESFHLRCSSSRPKT